MGSLHYDSTVRPVSTPMNAEQVYLEGECIVVPDGYVFPRVCLVTGEKVSTAPRVYRFARTKYVDKADIVPGSLAGLLAGREREHLGPKSSISFCLVDRLVKLRRNLAIGIVACLVLAIPLPSGIALWTGNNVTLLLIPVLIGLAGFCVWRRDAILHTKKVTPSFLWLVGVHPALRETIYRSGCREKKS